MSLQVHMDDSDSKKSKGGVFLCLAYNLFNIFLLALIYRNSTVIRSDGPAGFSELITKSFITWICLALFIGGLTTSIKNYRVSMDGFRLNVLCILTSSLLVFFSGAAVIEACSDDAGHCREWHIL